MAASLGACLVLLLLVVLQAAPLQGAAGTPVRPKSCFSNVKLRNLPVHLHDAVLRGGKEPVPLEIPRVDAHNLTRDQLLQEYLGVGRPVVVTGAIEAFWGPDAMTRWGDPATFAAEIQSLGGAIQEWNTPDTVPYTAWRNFEASPEGTLEEALERNFPWFPFLPERGKRRFPPNPEMILPTLSWMYHGVPGASAMPHRDTVCFGSFSSQMHGEKQWCLLDDWAGNASTADGARGQRLYSTILKPGETLMWTVPLLHETLILGDTYSLSLHGYIDLDPALPIVQDTMCPRLTSDPAFGEEYGVCGVSAIWRCANWSDHVYPEFQSEERGERVLVRRSRPRRRRRGGSRDEL